MPTSAIDSLVFRNMFGDSEVRQIWSDEYRTQCYLDWEAALARAQAGLSLIPQDAATEITRVCKVENIDFAKLEEESLNIGYPVLGVVHQCSPGAPSGSGNCNYVDGYFTAEAIEERRWARSLLGSFARGRTHD